MSRPLLRGCAAFLLGGLLPLWAQMLMSMLDVVRSNAANPWVHEFSAWAAAMSTVALAVAALAGDAAVACAIGAALGGLSFIGLAIALHRLPMPLVLALWPQASALGVVLPLMVAWLARRLHHRGR